MRDLHRKIPKPAGRNRLKKVKQPIDYRGLFRRALRIFGSLVVVSLALVIGYQVFGMLASATFLSLKKVEVNQLKRLTRDEVLNLAGVKPGDDMFSLSPRRIGEHLEKNPWVEKVKVHRYFPDTLAIELVERDPVAVVSLGYLYYLDTKGEIFKPLHEGDRLDYPIVTGVTEEDLAKDPKGSREALQGVLRLLAGLRGTESFGLNQVSEVHYDKGFGYTLFTVNGGVPVRVGTGDFTAKLARLGRIYRDLQANMSRMEYIDLDYTDKIVVKKG